jgi:hypothetical protein
LIDTDIIDVYFVKAMSKDIPIEFLASVFPYAGLTKQGTAEDLYRQILVTYHLSALDLASHSQLGGFVSLLDNLTTLCIAGVSTQAEQGSLGVRLPPGEEQAEGHVWLVPGFYYTDHRLCASRIFNPAEPDVVTSVSIPPTLPLSWDFIAFPEARNLWWGVGENPFAFRVDGGQKGELSQRAYLTQLSGTI